MLTVRLVALLMLAASGFGQDSAADAVQKYREALKRDPRNSLAHFLLGELFFQQSNFVGAANEFRSALNGDPHPTWIDTWAHIELGEIFDTTGQRAGGVQEYRQALKIKDDTQGAQAIAADLSSDGGRSHDADLHHVLNPYLRYMASIEMTFLLSSKQSRWHLLRVAFGHPNGVTRPHFLATS